MRYPSVNVLGGALEPCSTRPMTGFFRNGCCDTGPEDHGSHTVCAVMTAEFLALSKYLGNDLSTPRPEYGRHPCRRAEGGAAGDPATLRGGVSGIGLVRDGLEQVAGLTGQGLTEPGESVKAHALDVAGLQEAEVLHPDRPWRLCHCPGERMGGVVGLADPR